MLACIDSYPLGTDEPCILCTPILLQMGLAEEDLESYRVAGAEELKGILSRH